MKAFYLLVEEVKRFAETTMCLSLSCTAFDELRVWWQKEDDQDDVEISWGDNGQETSNLSSLSLEKTPPQKSCSLLLGITHLAQQLSKLTKSKDLKHLNESVMSLVRKSVVYSYWSRNTLSYTP